MHPEGLIRRKHEMNVKKKRKRDRPRKIWLQQIGKLRRTKEEMLDEVRILSIDKRRWKNEEFSS